MVNNYEFAFFRAKYANIGDMLDINDLDRTDLRLLAELQKDASLSNLELADKVGLSPTPCARRVKRLVTEGFIERQEDFNAHYCSCTAIVGNF